MTEYVPLETLQAAIQDIDRLLRACEKSAVQLPEPPLQPFDGEPIVRPHTIPGWWQVWSGSICIALLGPADVAPIVQAAGKALAAAAETSKTRRIK